jgi:peptidoglycan/xylan/chitin deacetylase (PgdA/CDA1 family)
MPELRVDRLVSLGMVRPALHLVGAARASRVPILMYHGIRDVSRQGRGYFETSTSPEMFVRQMRFLHENGYRTVAMREMVQTSKAEPDNRKRVAITFDDGYRDFYTHALPTLTRYGFTATMYIVSGLTGDLPITHGNAEYLGWNEIKEMHSLGIEIGSHTVSHPELWRLSQGDLEYELRHSKETIESAMGTPVRSFAHPFAFPEQNTAFTQLVSITLEKLGYQNAVSTIVGTAGRRHGRYCLPRLPINEHDDLPFFRAKMEGAYDWVHLAQRFYKVCIKRQSSAPRVLADRSL